MKKPGVVLRRPVGTNGEFTEHAELPNNLSTEKSQKSPTKTAPKAQDTSAQKIDDKAMRHTALVSERAHKRIEAVRIKAEVEREKEARRRSREIKNLNLTWNLSRKITRRGLRT